TVQDISLYDRSVRDAIEAGRVTPLDYDVFRTCVDIRFDVVRCMNLITHNYLPASRIAQAVANLRQSLTASGLLLVGRTTAAGRNNATVFRLREGRFVPERVVNDGADIHDIVVGLAPSQDPRGADSTEGPDGER